MLHRPNTLAECILAAERADGVFSGAGFKPAYTPSSSGAVPMELGSASYRSKPKRQGYKPGKGK